MDCAQCRAIVDGDIKRCKACINVRALSIAEVDNEYKGWLACEIIAARSHGGEHGNDAIDSVSGSSGDDGACGDVARAESEALAHA